MLDPELQGIVDLVNSAEQAPPTEEGVPGLRDAFAALVAMFGPGADAVRTRDDVVEGPAGEVPVRIYRPEQAGDGPLGALVWFHGGGWVIGDIETHDPLCRDLCDASGQAVVSVGYRLAPEHRFPAADEDCRAVVEHLLADGAAMGVASDRLVLGGDSAGGHLATVLCRQLRDRRSAGDLPGLAGQVLVYPVTDLAGGPAEHPSRTDNAEGYLLTAETMDFFSDTYLPDRDRRSGPDASPLRCEDLSGLPPAMVVVAEFDPLRDEGVAYARRLDEAGVPTELVHLDGAVHLCAQLRSTRVGAEVVERVAGFVRRHAGG